MKVSRAAQVAVVLVLVALVSLGPRAAELGTLQCLRDDRTADIKICMSCHDGSLASNIKLSAARPSDAAPYRDHPVSVDYAAAQARTPSEFVPPSLLDPQLKLINGEVQCVTCHLADTNGNWTLVKTEFRGPFCLNCHRK